MAAQLGLFQASLNVLRDLKKVMAADADACGLSREALCERLNELAERYGVRLVKGSGPKITMATLEKWLNPEDGERVIPAKGLPVWCAATGRLSVLRCLAAPLGGQVIDENQARLLERARLEEEIKERKARIRQLTEDMRHAAQQR